jgi:hypothetical protein
MARSSATPSASDGAGDAQPDRRPRRGGATPANVAKLTIILVEGVDVNEGFAASRKVWGDQPTAITAMFVRALGRPDCLVDVDAIAAVPG